jgi:hypothetical protein
MLISEGNDGSDIVKYLLKSIGRKFTELVGSKYKNDLRSGRYSEEILNKIKYIMETDNVLILRDLDMIYPSLYDLFNQNFTCMGDKKFARIAFEYAKISSEVNKDFHGNRDFYNLIKNAMRDLKKKKASLKNKLEIHENKILTRVGISSLERNFGGLEDSIRKIKEIFKEQFGHKFDYENYNPEKSQSILEIIRNNILDSNSRYLMLISDGNDASDIIKYLLNSMDKKYIELIGSKYKADIKSGRYSEEILNTIKYIMETNNILILKELDMIYVSLYD